MNVLNRPAIKFEARNFISIDRRWLAIFLAGIVPFLIDLLSYPSNINSLLNRYDLSHYYLSSTLSNYNGLINIISFFAIPISIALYGYRVNCLRYNRFESKNVYFTARFNYLKFLITEFVRRILIILWAFLLIVPSIIKTIAYSMTGYIICDNPELSPLDAIKLSDRITRGYKWDIFVMYLSFIPWYFLSAITCGIASIYVIPYVGITEAMFYENLKKHAIEADVVSQSEFGIY